MAVNRQECLSALLTVSLGLLLFGCGGGSSAPSSSTTNPPPVTISVSLSPLTVQVLTNQTQTFMATASGTTNQNFTWSIDGAGTGNSTVGHIASDGTYTAPAVVPLTAMITIRAISTADTTRSATAAVTIASPVEDWPKYRRDLANTGRSIETGISSVNADQLQVKWKFDTGAKVSASPAVATVNGTRMVFIGSWDGVFHALNANTGAEIWSFKIDPALDAGSCAGGAVHCTRITSSPAVSNGVVYFGAGNGYVYALDAATGAEHWGALLGDPTQGVEIWTSPAVNNGLVYEAVASHNDNPCVAGRVVALKTSDGSVSWTFDATDPTVPGVGIWSSPALDTSVNPPMLYIGTGNPGNGCTPQVSTTPAFSYPDGIVALNGTTGSLDSKNYAPAVLTDTTDCCDFGSSPIIHRTPSGSGGTTTWVTEANKDGDVFTYPIDATGFVDTSGPPVQLGPFMPGEVIASPAVRPGQTSTDANTIFLPTESDTLFILEQAASGSVSVKSTVIVNPSNSFCATIGNCPLYSAPASMTDILLFGGGEGNFYIFDEAGNYLNSVGTNGLVASGPAISHNRVYFGSYDGSVYCLSLNGQ